MLPARAQEYQSLKVAGSKRVRFSESKFPASEKPHSDGVLDTVHEQNQQ
jgi:hypothetical protein